MQCSLVKELPPSQPQKSDFFKFLKNGLKRHGLSSCSLTEQSYCYDIAKD